MKKIALGLSIFFHIDNFSKLFSLGVSEFCHQINFDGTELFARPDTLSYVVVTLEPIMQCTPGSILQNRYHVLLKV